jgi:hypothetical protein
MHLFITEIPAEAKFSAALAAFEPFGRIRSLTFLSTKDGTHSGRAFLSFHDPDSRVKCLAQSRKLKALSNFFDLPPAHPTFRDLMIGIGQIRSSVFFIFFRPSSTPPIFSKALQASLTFSGFQIRSIRFVWFTFLRRPSLSFLDCLPPSAPSEFNSMNSFGSRSFFDLLSLFSSRLSSMRKCTSATVSESMMKSRSGPGI